MTRTVPPEWIRGPNDLRAIEEGCTWDDAASWKPIRFLETFCRQSKGRRWAGQPLKLLPWQIDWIRRLFGWRRPDGSRRFTSTYIEVPKKNGKSCLTSGLALYLAIADGEPGAEVYILAFDRSQTRTVFDETVRMVKQDEDLASELRYTESDSAGLRIVHEASFSKIEALSKEADNKDGFNASAVIFDELHRQRDRKLWAMFEHAGAARESFLRIAITTAGGRMEGVCWEQHKYSRGVESGKIRDTTHLGVIYGADRRDDPDSPETWKKANPSWGSIIDPGRFAHDHRRARNGTREEWRDFLRLRLGRWGEDAEAYFDLNAWEACEIPGLMPEAGRPCYGGLDLASTSDLAAYTLLFPIEIGETTYFDLFCLIWMPEAAYRDRVAAGLQPWKDWRDDGWIIVTKGSRIDYEAIEEEIVELHQVWPLVRAASDPHNATMLVGRLIDPHGLPFVYVSQQYKGVSEPTKEFDRAIANGQVRHPGNPVLTWAMGNAVPIKDGFGNIRLNKRTSFEKIDPAAATINAVAAYMLPETAAEPTPTVEVWGEEPAA